MIGKVQEFRNFRSPRVVRWQIDRISSDNWPWYISCYDNAAWLPQKMFVSGR